MGFHLKLAARMNQLKQVFAEADESDIFAYLSHAGFVCGAVIFSVLISSITSWSFFSRLALISLGVLCTVVVHIWIQMRARRLQRSDNDQFKGLEEVETVGGKLRLTSQDIAQSATTLRHTSHSFTKGVADQMRAVQDSLDVISEFSLTVEESSDSAKNAYEMASSINTLAQSGQAIISSSRESMMEIDRVHELLADLVSMIGGIESKTAIIEEIMQEAKLLAFNAMLEAARAGEHGRGFSVVAQSLQNLSSLCTEASREIRLLIQNGNEKSDTIIKEIQRRLSDTKNVNDQVISKFVDITTGVERVSSSLERIREAATKQELGIVQCAESMALVYATTASNRKVSDQAGTCGEILNLKSQEMEGISSSLESLSTSWKAKAS